MRDVCFACSARGVSGRRGFSMVELAIVIVVMGLIAAAVTAGKMMLASAEIHALIGEAENYKLQIDNFHSKYDSLPGDLRNANAVWPEAQNGDGDGRVEESEAFGVWQQLKFAELIAGNFTGTGPDAVVGGNVPVSHYNGAGYDFVWHDAPGGWKDQAGRVLAGNYLRYGRSGMATGGADFLTKGALNGDKAAAVDEKLDNGIPSFGSVLAVSGEGAPDGGCYAVDGKSYSRDVQGSPMCVVLFATGYGK